MQLVPTPNGDIISLSPHEVRWLLRMIAEWLFAGIVLHDTDHEPPHISVARFAEHLWIRWADLIIEATEDEDAQEWLYGLGETAATAAYAITAWTDLRPPTPSRTRDRAALHDVDTAIASLWGKAPGVLPIPSFGEFTAEWLGNATFEYVRRLGVPALRDRPECVRAAGWVLAQLPATQMWSDLNDEAWQRYRGHLSAADLQLDAP